MNVFNPAQFRAQFPALQDAGVYLDSAATALKPEAVVEATRQFYSLSAGNVHRSQFAEAQKLGLSAQRRSLGQRIEPQTQVYLADSMGELWLWYALSQACFVGGSLNAPGGGQVGEVDRLGHRNGHRLDVGRVTAG